MAPTAEDETAPPRLFDLLEDSIVPMHIMHERYGPIFNIIEALLTEVPNCESVLEVAPPAMTQYNLLVPNLLNLPFNIFYNALPLGAFGPPAELQGPAMMAASVAARCVYCSAHTCVYSLQAGVNEGLVAAAGSHTGAAAPAAIRVARALSTLPSRLTDKLRAEFMDDPTISAANKEWSVLSVALMGFLNKTMDAHGVPLEDNAIRISTQHLAPQGWWRVSQHYQTPPAAGPVMGRTWGQWWRSLGLGMTGRALSVMPYLPFALNYNAQHTKGVPDKWPAVGRHLEAATGGIRYGYLAQLQHARAVQAIAAVSCQSFATWSGSRVSPAVKAMACLMFARVAGNEYLQSLALFLLSNAVATDGGNEAVLPKALSAAALASTLRTSPAAPEVTAARRALEPAKLGKVEGAMMLVVQAIVTSPARVTKPLVDAARTAGITPEEVVELVALISVQQLHHRLSTFFRPQGPYGGVGDEGPAVAQALDAMGSVMAGLSAQQD